MPVPETAWRLKKARELVKLLALAPGHRLHREQVMDVLWRDRRPASLPADASSFIGRGRELAELKPLLRGTRLLTLAGTGGAGKTRLALELARAVEPSYPDGAALVELAALADPRRVPDAVAAALDVR